MSQPLPPAACLVAHRVADYEAWKKAFDDDMPARKAGACLGHHINRGIDDPNSVYVYCPASDLGDLMGFLNSAELPIIMNKAGVQGPAEVTLMKPMSANFVHDQSLPGIIAIHAVEDYDTWREAYDAFDEFRKKSGIVGDAVNQEVGKPNQVIVYHQASDVDALRGFVDANELKAVMQRGGVVGAPDIRFVKSESFVTY